MKPGRVLRMVAALLALGAASALLAEGAVRFRQWVRHGTASPIDEALAIDPETGLRVLIPNRVHGKIRVNSLGFRGPELVMPKPPGVVRLAFLGGSTTFCAEVGGNEVTWPHLVWASLEEALPDVQFDYVNTGVPGYGLEAILRTFTLRVQRLEPDVVVIYEATNDLSLDSRRLARDRQLIPDVPTQAGGLARYSLLWFLVDMNLSIRRLQATAESDAGKLVFDPRELSRGFEQRLRNTIHAAQEVAEVVAVVTFSPRIRRGQSVAERKQAAVTSLYYMPYMTLDGLVAGYEEYNRVIRSVAAETGAVLIGGEEQIPADDVHYNDSVHFRDTGSRAMAARVSQALLDAPPFRELVSARAGR